MSIISDEALTGSLHLSGAALGMVKHLLALEQIDALNDSCAAHSGPEFADAVLRKLDVKLDVAAGAFSALTPDQPMVVISNHPFGMLDGLILIKLVGERIRRFKMPSNYLMSGVEGLRGNFIYVNSFDDHGDNRSNVANLRALLRLARDGNSLVIFPAGDASHFQISRLCVEDRDWDPASVKLVRKMNLPVLPVFIGGRNSLTYQIMNLIHHRLGLLRIPRELLNKRGHAVRVVTGAPFRLSAQDMAADIPALAAMLKHRVYALRGS